MAPWSPPNKVDRSCVHSFILILSSNDINVIYTEYIILGIGNSASSKSNIISTQQKHSIAIKWQDYLDTSLKQRNSFIFWFLITFSVAQTYCHNLNVTIVENDAPCERCGNFLINLKIFGIIVGIFLGGMLIGAILGALMLPALGFGIGGIVGGSLAAACQGPAVAAGSCFAIFQSLGASKVGIVLFGALGCIGGGILSIYLLYYKYYNDIGWCKCD